jgi:2-C-methyl-D-erythritol 2,4-cyclodiphosphate synthase
MADQEAGLRFGLGFDSHPKGTAPPLHLGGLRWEDEDRLTGHSDGDVVCHALADALLGACALGDIGRHFPEADPALSGIPGLDLLGRTVSILADSGFAPVSCDIVVVAERPLLGPRSDEVRRALAGAMEVPAGMVSVKGTRPQGLGLSGDGAACLALAVVRPGRR